VLIPTPGTARDIRGDGLAGDRLHRAVLAPGSVAEGGGLLGRQAQCHWHGEDDTVRYHGVKAAPSCNEYPADVQWPEESHAAIDDLRLSFERIVASPTPEDLWAFQKILLTIGGADGARARALARAFHSCLRMLASKSASRTASRWSAVLGTAAVGSVNLSELRDGQERGLQELLERGLLPAALEIGAAVQSAEAWEIEARLIYDEFAWFLYEELWDLSATTRPELAPDERRQRIDELLDPLLDPSVSDVDRAALLVDVFRSAFVARAWPLLNTTTTG